MQLSGALFLLIETDDWVKSLASHHPLLFLILLPISFLVFLVCMFVFLRMVARGAHYVAETQLETDDAGPVRRRFTKFTAMLFAAAVVILIIALVHFTPDPHAYIARKWPMGAPYVDAAAFVLMIVGAWGLYRLHHFPDSSEEDESSDDEDGEEEENNP